MLTKLYLEFIKGIFVLLSIDTICLKLLYSGLCIIHPLNEILQSKNKTRNESEKIVKCVKNVMNIVFNLLLNDILC